MKTLLVATVAALVLAPLVGAQVVLYPPGSTNTPARFSSTNQLQSVAIQENRPPVASVSTSELHDVIGTNAPKSGMHEPTLTNQPIKSLPLP